MRTTPERLFSGRWLFQPAKLAAGAVTLAVALVLSVSPAGAQVYGDDDGVAVEEEEWYDPSGWFDGDEVDYEGYGDDWSDQYGFGGEYYDSYDYDEYADYGDGDEGYYEDSYYTDTWYDEDDSFFGWYD